MYQGRQFHQDDPDWGLISEEQEISIREHVS